MRNMWKLLPVVLLASCAWLEPNLKLPKFEAPKDYTVLKPENLGFVSSTEVGSWEMAKTRVAEPRGNWWEIYNDPQLNTLMQQAMTDNPDLQVMAARVKQARGQAGLASSLLFPAIYADGGVTREKVSAASIQQFGGGGGTTNIHPQTTYNVGLNASYELDLFGRIAGGARQAKFASLAQQDLYESTKLSLQADVVQAYFAARTAGSVLDDISESLVLGEKSLALAKRMYELGDTSSQVYQQNVADLMNLRSDALDVQRQRLVANNQLATLLGKVPGSVVIEDSSTLAALPPMIPAGVPATLLERRPDVAAAQNQLASANAGIGAARAAFFPSINLTGNAGYAAQQFGDLFKQSTSTWAFGPAVTLPIFQGSTNISNLRLQWGKYEEAVAVYKQQVLAAFSDVDNALTTHRITLEQASSRQQAMAELDRTADMAQRQFEVGDMGMQEYYGVKQQALVGRINEQQSLLNAYTASAQLVRALGGSWEASAK